MVGFHVPDYDQVPEYRTCETEHGMPTILERFDARDFARALREAHVQAFWFYSKCHRGNAYYPSKVGHVHSAIGDRDLFGELCDACLAEGIVPLCVYEFSDMRMPKDHPDWCHKLPSADADAGDATDALEGARVGGPCLNGPYGEFALEQTREVLKTYPIQGYYIDFLGLFGMDNWICPHCSKKYQAAFGRPFTGTSNLDHDQYVRYVRWWYNENDHYARRVRTLVRQLRPDVLFTHNFHGWADCPNMQRMDFASENCDFVAGDLFQLRAGMLQMSWKIRGYATLSRCRPADVLLDGMACVRGDFNTPKALATYNAELWTARSLNVGTTASVVMNIDGSFNPHVIQVVKRAYGEHKAYEPWLLDMEPIANVGIVRSHDALEFRPGSRGDLDGQTAPHAQDFTGWCQALIAAHCLWDLVPAHRLEVEALTRLQALVLPSVSCMSAAQCDAVRAFVDGGGTLIASGETSLFDADGHQLDDFQLADLFGAHLVDPCSPDRKYFKVDDPAFAPDQPWVDSLVAMSDGQLGIRAEPQADVLGTVHANPGISLVNVLMDTGEPAWLRHSVGKGQCYYFAGAIGRQYRRYGQANALRLLKAVLNKSVGDAAPVALDGPGSVELFAHTQRGKDHLVVNVVNIFAGLSRSDGRGVAQVGREVTPDVRHDEYEQSPVLSEVVLRFRPFRGRQVRKAWVAPDGEALPLRVRGDETLVAVRDLAEHAMIVAEY